MGLDECGPDTGRIADVTVWVVILEFNVAPDLFEVETVDALVEHLREWDPIGMYHPERYALQLHLPATAAADALGIAMANHNHAARALGTTSSFIRAEVLTLGEFEAAWLAGVTETDAAASRSGHELASTGAYEATRALIGASTTQEVTDVVVRFVHAAGGSVHVGGPCHIPGMVSIDLFIVGDQALYASAEAVSMAGLVIQRWLPPLIDDAKSALVLLERR